MKADKRLGLVALSLLLLAGCGGGAVEVRAVPQTVIVVQTVIVPQTVVVTAIPEPTSTRPPTPPDGRTFSTGDVIGAFIAYHLIDERGIRVLQKADYGLAPLLGEGLRFALPDLCADCGGRVLAFASVADRDAMRTYYEGLGKQSAALFSWVFVRDNILVQINGALPAERAKRFDEVLHGM
jgi:hypothetical protein